MPRRVARRRLEGSSPLNITSMMDMFTIILVFLLNVFSEHPSGITLNDQLRLPVAHQGQKPERAVMVVVSRSQLLVDGVHVADLDAGSLTFKPGDLEGLVVKPLVGPLQRAAEAARASSPSGEFTGRLLLQCERELPFAVVQQVMYTAGEAGFEEFQFVVYQG